MAILNHSFDTIKILEKIDKLFGKKSNYQLFQALILVLIVSSIGACGIAAKTRAAIKGDLNMYVSIAAKVNSDNPLPVDVVWVYDEDLLKELLKLSAKTWFEKKEQFRRDFPSNEAFEVWPWEWTPGQKVAVQKIPIKAKSKGGIIFANYLIDGDHRARIDPAEDFQINFSEESFSLQEPKD
jgi:type VI secretion system protein